jgi:hypothetical protein
MILGNIYPLIISTTKGSMYAWPTMNPPVKIRRPMLNSFVVSLLAIDGDAWEDGSEEPLSDYNLILHFRAIIPLLK